jgi:hypothetical protein
MVKHGTCRVHTLPLAVFFCGDCGRAVHSKLQTGAVKRAKQPQNVAL